MREFYSLLRFSVQAFFFTLCVSSSLKCNLWYMQLSHESCFLLASLNNLANALLTMEVEESSQKSVGILHFLKLYHPL